MKRLFFSVLSSFFFISSCFAHYDLHYTRIQGESSGVIVCLHGYGDSYQLAERIKEEGNLKETLIGFNFPDHDLVKGQFDPKKLSFGSIQELLPVLEVLKKCVIEENIERVSLYGFSAGGGALINTLALLNTTTYDVELKRIGLGASEKKKLLRAIQKGTIILDTPLKSVEEIIDFQESTEVLEIIARNYQKNNLRPIDSLQHLDNLPLNILLYFEMPDEVLSNRDDALYLERLQKYNAKGTTSIIIGNHGGHTQPHHSLWQAYEKMKN